MAMKYILVLLVAAVMSELAEETYGTDYDDLDIEAIVADTERFQSFVDCFMDVAPCNEVTAAFKNQIPEAIIQACAKCTNAQKHIVKVFFEGFKKNMPQELVKFKDIYDPERKYFSKFEAAVADF